MEEEKYLENATDLNQELEKLRRRFRFARLVSFQVITLSEQLHTNQLEAAFTYNVLKFAVATNNTDDKNTIAEARKDYILNYYYLMSIYPDENVNSLAEQMGLCYNQRDELLQDNKVFEAFKKQQECKKIEAELESTLYSIMKEKGFEDFMYKKVNPHEVGETGPKSKAE